MNYSTETIIADELGRIATALERIADDQEKLSAVTGNIYNVLALLFSRTGRVTLDEIEAGIKGSKE